MNKKNLSSFLIYVVWVVALWFFTVPSFSSLFKIKGEINLKKRAIELERQVIDKLNSISRILDSQKGNVERLEQAIPSSEFKPEILSIMENLASQSGLALSSINISSEDGSSRSSLRVKDSGGAANSIDVFKIDVQMSGSYSSFKSWLESIEKNLRITDVVKISFDILEKKTSEGAIIPAIDPVIGFGVTMNTYVLKK